jgi:uncharacterized protein (DUF885 family)
VASSWGTDMSDGWSHYCEELMREVLFRDSPASRLLTAQHGLTFALSAAIDISLASGRFDAARAADVLVRRTGLAPNVARARVRTMLRTPTRALSTLLGKIRIEQLRREARRRWRTAYRDARFHTLLLASGPLPLAYLFEMLDGPPSYLSNTPTSEMLLDEEARAARQALGQQAERSADELS